MRATSFILVYLYAVQLGIFMQPSPNLLLILNHEIKAEHSSLTFHEGLTLMDWTLGYSPKGNISVVE